MTIRQTLLVAFLFFSIISASLMTVLSYNFSRSELSDEIRLNLESQALSTMHQIDAMLFERIENLYGWSQLDIFQDIKIRDIDKRLSNFLSDINSAYGTL